MSRAITLEYLLSNTKEEGNCMVWQGRSYNGCPKCRIDGNSRHVRREVYEQVYGELPARLQVGVKCKTPLCVAPDCLVARTRSAAMKVAKFTAAGRAANVAAARRRAKLTIEVARQIRASDKPSAVLDRELGLFAGCASRIRTNRSWVDHSNPFAGLGA